MNSRTPRILLALALSVIAGYGIAQERTATQPFNGAGDITSPALVQKISYLKQVNTVLEAQLNACRTGQPMPTAPEVTVKDNGDFATKQAVTAGQDGIEPTSSSEGTSQVNMHWAQPTAPRRTGGVIQQASEPKLTCDDYSMSYFSRHPAMAAVCGKTDELQQQSAPAVQAPAATPAVNATTATSPTAPLRPRIYSTSGTVPIRHL